VKSEAQALGINASHAAGTGIEADTRPYPLLTTDMGAQPLHSLGRPVENIREYREAVTSAMDFLFQGS